MPTLKPDLLLFDLGGVLVDFSGPRDLAAFMRAPAPPADILKRWATCPHTTAYEGGEISAQEWAARFVRDWDVELAPDGFLAEFRSWSRGFLPGARELLAELRPRYRLAAVSNSNAILRVGPLSLRRTDTFDLKCAEATARGPRARGDVPRAFFFDRQQTRRACGG